METSFNPDQISVKNGCFLGLDYAVEDAELVLLRAPWDVTTSYRPGTQHGPAAMIEASYQLDMYTPRLERAWERKIATAPLDPKWKTLNDRLRKNAESVIRKLEEGVPPDDASIVSALDIVNGEGRPFHEDLYRQAKTQLDAGRAVLTVGGDHSISEGPIRAHAERFPGLSILHIDAHADLRHEYEGFAQSHASIMNNVIRNTGVKKLVQVGIRDVSPTEIRFIGEHKDRIHTHFDWDLKRAAFEGETWAATAKRIVSGLTDQVYLSFDIDGLDPRFCPDTGTPVPGGLDFDQVGYLFDAVRASGRTVVGGDLVEVAPGDPYQEWNANVGARTLWLMALTILAGRK